MGENTTKLRKINAKTIRQVLKNNPNITKAAVAEKTGLSYSTCNIILNEMVETGEVFASEQTIISGGRPAQIYNFNAQFNTMICFYIIEHQPEPLAVYAIFDLSGNILEDGYSLMPQPDENTIETFLANLLAKHPRTNVIGIGLPAVIMDYRTISFSDFPRLENIPLAEQLENKFKIPIIIENDANLTALGLSHSSAAKQSVIALYFPKESHPGSGVVINGEIVRGFSNFAGEIAYLPSDYGMGQDTVAQNSSEAAKQAAYIISAFACTLNPEFILLTGPILNDKMIPDILRWCNKYTPSEHLPQLTYISDTKSYYLMGLWTLIQKNTITLFESI